MLNKFICKIFGHTWPRKLDSSVSSSFHYREVEYISFVAESDAWRCPRCNRLVFNKSGAKTYGN
jgi:hypothetical protein